MRTNPWRGAWVHAAAVALIAAGALGGCEQPADEEGLGVEEGFGEELGAVGEPVASPTPRVLGALAETTPGPEAPAEAVHVRLVDYRIEMPHTLPPGPTTFHVVNEGSVVHSFEVEGQGIEKVLDDRLQPGESATLQVDLQPGTYTVYCPVADHRQRGMELTLTVG